MGQVDAIKVSSIHFVGNESFSEGVLRDLMLVEESSWFSTAYFSEADLQGDLEMIRTFYRDEGFLLAQISSPDLQFDDEHLHVNISIHIIEGMPTTIENIALDGASYFSKDQVLDKLGIHPGERFRQQLVNRAQGEIKKMYRNIGFLDISVTTTTELSKEKRACEISFLIEENERYRINNVVIEGLEKTEPNIVERELGFTRNEYINLQVLAQSRRNLYQTGLFKSVSIKPGTTPDSVLNEKDIIITVQEDDPGSIDVSLGFGTIEKVRASSELSYQNILGKAYHASIGGKASSVERKVESSITDPWVFNIPWGASISGEVGRVNQPSYAFSFLGGTLTFYKDLLHRSRFAVSGSYETGKLDELRIGILDDSVTTGRTYELEEILKGLDVSVQRTSGRVSLLHDTRDNLFSPVSGYYLDCSSEFIYGVAKVSYLGLQVLRAVNRFARSEVVFNYYQSLNGSTTLASALSVGIINNFTKRELTFLLDDLYYAGGPNALRGFAYQRVGPLAENGNPLGGELRLVWNLLEIRRRLFWIVGAVAFFDLGNVWSRPEDFTFRHLRYSPGIGLRLETPIGIGRLDYGFNPWPKPGEKHGQLWVSLGHAF